MWCWFYAASNAMTKQEIFSWTWNQIIFFVESSWMSKSLYVKLTKIFRRNNITFHPNILTAAYNWAIKISNNFSSLNLYILLSSLLDISFFDMFYGNYKSFTWKLSVISQGINLSEDDKPTVWGKKWQSDREKSEVVILWCRFSGTHQQSLSVCDAIHRMQRELVIIRNWSSLKCALKRDFSLVHFSIVHSSR